MTRTHPFVAPDRDIGDRSLVSLLVSNGLVLATFVGALYGASVVHSALQAAPTLAVAAAFLVVVATVVFVPLTATAAVRRLRAAAERIRDRRDGRPEPTPDRPTDRSARPHRR